MDALASSLIAPYNICLLNDLYFTAGYGALRLLERRPDVAERHTSVASCVTGLCYRFPRIDDPTDGVDDLCHE